MSGETVPAYSLWTGPDTEWLGEAYEDALIKLRTSHADMVRRCGKKHSHVPCRAKSVPGWIYLPDQDRVKESSNV